MKTARPSFSINTDVFDIDENIEPRLRLLAEAGFRSDH